MNKNIENKTSFLSPHLRFGSISIRECVKYASSKNKVFLSELIWREFYSQILYNFPHVVNQPFKSKYSKIKWRSVNTDGIKDIWKWEIVCMGCKIVKIMPESTTNQKNNLGQCVECGSKLKVRKKK